ncbi:type III secretion system protein SpaR [Serratia quinivorans]|uniref:type III secretion system export apparatus subunit SctT n=1 Tax=Serratia quinivorans TaxID=137545 RepID=UPI00217890E2|nr:type III secretion system export apparatus subunit SctT [Serratia quinivorans]CAI1903721.1 type III secretion system protein SpaR [Serratia quinivorans]
MNPQMQFQAFGQLNEWLVTLMLGWLRIAPLFFLLPFLNSKLIGSAVLKNCIIIYICLGMWPFFSDSTEKMQNISGWLHVMIYEFTIGLVLALFICLPFLIANIIGELIDNQRGATISDTIDPANGIESSELSVLVNYIVCMIFLAQGGLYKMMALFAESYRVLPFSQGFSRFDPMVMGAWLNNLVLQGLVLSSPVLVTLFICEVALGVYSRFCPQLNAFSLSLAVKSIVAFSVFLLYFQNEVPSILVSMVDISPLGKMFTLSQ